jgi:hypothetical protein
LKLEEFRFSFTPGFSPVISGRKMCETVLTVCSEQTERSGAELEGVTPAASLETVETVFLSLHEFGVTGLKPGVNERWALRLLRQAPCIIDRFLALTKSFSES